MHSMKQPDPVDLPCWELRHQDHRLRVFDPREDPTALGARYVHGGYVSSWFIGDRQLAGRPQLDWDPYVGEGLPEVFEMPLGWGACQPGECYLRIGAGRMVRGTGGWSAAGQLSEPVSWQLLDQTNSSIQMQCEDGVVIADDRYGYQLKRHVWLDEQGCHSHSQLRIDCPWSEPMVWFTHPFFLCSAGDRIAMRLPTGIEGGTDALQADKDRYRLAADGGFCPLTGINGQAVDIGLHWDASDGGGRLDIAGDYPLDKIVVFGTDRALSVEPYMCLTMHGGRQQSWTVHYQFQA